MHFQTTESQIYNEILRDKEKKTSTLLVEKQKLESFPAPQNLHRQEARRHEISSVEEEK